MSQRTFKSSSNHFQTLVSVFDQARAPFRPKCLPNQKLAQEIESCKRKIWECIGPAERQRHLDKKQKTQRSLIIENKENAASRSIVKSVDIPVKSSMQQQQSASAAQQLPKKSLTSRSTIEFRVNAMKVVQLKKELKDRGYETSGLKKDLRARLLDAMLVELEMEGSMDIPLASIPEKLANVKIETAPSSISNPVDTEENAVVGDDCTKGKESEQTSSATIDSLGAKKMSIEPTNLEPPKKMSIESLQPHGSKKMSIEPQPKQDLSEHQTNRESISSMQVEHHGTTTTGESVHKRDGNDKCTKKEIAGHNSPAKPVVMSSALLHSPALVIHAKQQPPLSSSKKVSTDSTTKSIKSIPATIKENELPQQPERLPSAIKIGKASVSSSTSSDSNLRVPSEASSSISKGSGKMVRDMISKFSGQTPLASSATGASSSVSKEMKKIAESRKAKIAEIRLKSKTNTATKLGMTTPSEPRSTQKTMGLKGPLASASAKKDMLAAQMREKTAAAAAAAAAAGGSIHKKPFMGSSSKLAAVSSNKGPSAHPSGGVQDSLGSTLKRSAIKPIVKTKVHSPVDTYEISDREGSDSDSDSEAENDQQKKRIPTWATRPKLIQALEEQYHGKVNGKRVDPDDIFPEVQSCDLVAIFGNRKADRYRSRNSSGNWMRDKVTAAEKLVYKRDMGFHITHHEREESEI